MDGYRKRTIISKSRKVPSFAEPGWFRIWFLLILCVSVSLSNILFAEEDLDPVTYIESIQVKDNQRIEKDAILAVIMTRKGDRFDYHQLDKDLRGIYRMKYFMDVKVDVKDGTSGKIVTFIVTEKPSIGEIVFSGNSNLRDPELKEEVGITLYSILDNNEIKQSINRLLDFYREKGYYNAKILCKTESLPNNEVLLKYKITERDKVYVSKITFRGNSKFDDGDLKDIMKSSEKGIFSWITDSGYLNEKMLEYDIHVITAYYNNHGFIKAIVGDPKITFDKDEGITITIDIEEGAQYRVNTVSVKGDLLMPEDELLEIVLMDNEGVFNRDVVRNDILALKDVYVDKGYAYAEINTSTKEDDAKYLVDITYIVSKGSKVRFERINIIGNSVTRDKVIRRELNVIEGEDYSGSALTTSTENLNRLGFFEDVEMVTKKGTKDDLMILDVTVKERPTGSFSVGAGYSSEDAIFVTFRISQENFLGRGQKLQTSASIGGTSTNFNISFTEPWLFDTRLSGSVNIYKTKQEYDDYSYDDYDVDQYTRESQGLGLGFGFPIDKIDRFTRGSVRYAYDVSDIGDVPDSASWAWRDMAGKNTTSSITFGISRDTRDKPWDTSRGSINTFSFEFAGRCLGGDVQFDRIRASSGWFFPAFWKTVFCVRGSWAYVIERSGGKLPVYQKFRIGGLSSVRGFEAGSISPIDPHGGEYIGGEKMMFYNFEYRVPVLKEQGITAFVFYDCGNVWEKRDNYSFSDIRKSAGGGIRWYSPMGPLLLAYGKNLDPLDHEESGKWEFSIGGGF